MYRPSTSRAPAQKTRSRRSKAPLRGQGTSAQPLPSSPTLRSQLAPQVFEQRHDPEHQRDTDEKPDQPPTPHHRTAEHSIPTHHVSSAVLGQRSLAVRKRSALTMTLTEDSDMAAAAMIGDSSRPNAG